MIEGIGVKILIEFKCECECDRGFECECGCEWEREYQWECTCSISVVRYCDDEHYCTTQYLFEFVSLYYVKTKSKQIEKYFNQNRS